MLDLQAYLALQFTAYQEHGILLSQPELALIQRGQDSLVIGPEVRAYIDASQASIDRELDLNLRTLEEAEQARDEAQRLQAEAEITSEALATANSQLAERNADVEGKLATEKDWRSKQERTNFQRQFSFWLLILVAFTLLIPYIGAALGAPEKLIDNTGQLSLLLIQTVGVIAGFLFNRRQDENSA